MNYTTIEPLLKKLVPELDDENMLGLMLVGSYSKGTATEQSDIDITRFVQNTEVTGQTLRIYEGKVLELLEMPLPESVSFKQPEVALFAVPLWRQAHILADKTGRLVQFQREAQAFQWESIREAANERVSYGLYRKSVEVHSLIGALEANDDWAVYTLCAFLLNGLAEAVLIHTGNFVRNEKSLFRQAQESAGLESEWSVLLERAAGLKLAGTGESLMQARGAATLKLYASTAALMHDLIKPEHRALVERALEAIRHVVP